MGILTWKDNIFKIKNKSKGCSKHRSCLALHKAFTIFFMQYIWLCFSPPPTAPRSSSFPYPHNFLFSFFQRIKKNSWKHKNEKQNKQKNPLKPNKTKNTQIKQTKTKNPNKPPGACSVLANYSWAQGLPWSVVGLAQWHSTGKKDFFFASKCQL